VKIRCVVDRAVGAKWHIEFAATIETAEPVKAGAIQIVKQLGSFGSVPEPLLNHIVKSSAVLIEQRFVISHFYLNFETGLEMTIEINEMRVYVVQKRVVW
jgi:hypothetical protein